MKQWNKSSQKVIRFRSMWWSLSSLICTDRCWSETQRSDGIQLVCVCVCARGLVRLFIYFTHLTWTDYYCCCLNKTVCATASERAAQQRFHFENKFFRCRYSVIKSNLIPIYLQQKMNGTNLTILLTFALRTRQFSERKSNLFRSDLWPQADSSNGREGERKWCWKISERRNGKQKQSQKTDRKKNSAQDETTICLS